MSEIGGWRSKVEAAAGMNAVPAFPAWRGEHGVIIPICSDSCPQHDGKRCMLLGVQAPEFHVCEPVAVEMAKMLDESDGLSQRRKQP